MAENFWSRLSAKTKERIFRVALYLVIIVVLWFIGSPKKVSPATAFFGLAAITGLYNLAFSWAKKILEGSKTTDA